MRPGWRWWVPETETSDVEIWPDAEATGGNGVCWDAVETAWANAEASWDAETPWDPEATMIDVEPHEPLAAQVKPNWLQRWWYATRWHACDFKYKACDNMTAGHVFAECTSTWMCRCGKHMSEAKIPAARVVRRLVSPSR